MLLLILLLTSSVIFESSSLIDEKIKPTRNVLKDRWKKLHLIAVGCVKDSKDDERVKVQANLDQLASMWRHSHFVIYADKVSKQKWEAEIAETKGSNHSYTFLLDDFHHNDRVVRIMHCRNTLLQRVKSMLSKPKSTLREDNTLLAVIDLDDMNAPRHTKETIIHAMELINQWDVVSFNRPYYYDIWALRYKDHDINVWAPGVDSMEEIAKMRSDVQDQLTRNTLLDVYSAFGGIGFYKYKFIKDCHYHLRENEVECEHPNMHKCIREKGGRVRIFNETIMDEFHKGPHRRIRLRRN